MRKGYIAAAVLYMGVIYLLSSQPPDSPYVPLLPWNLDKAAHALEYALLGYLLGKGFGTRGWGSALAFFIGAIYGVSDEYHQSFVAGRDASASDWAGDVAGSLAGVILSRRNRPVTPEARNDIDSLIIGLTCIRHPGENRGPEALDSGSCRNDGNRRCQDYSETLDDEKQGGSDGE